MLSPVIGAIAEKALHIVELTVVIPNVADRDLSKAVQRHVHSAPWSSCRLHQSLVAGIRDGGGQSGGRFIEHLGSTGLRLAGLGQHVLFGFVDRRRAALLQCKR